MNRKRPSKSGKDEVERIIKETLGSKTPETLQKELSETMKTFMQQRAAHEEKEIIQHIQELIRNIPNEEKYKKAESKAHYIQKRTKELEDSREERIQNMKKKLNNEYNYINSFFTAVKAGQSISYQTATPDGNVDVPALFLGFKINPAKKNPYAPSAITARIATTDSNRYIELVLSGEQGNQLQAIFFASSNRNSGTNVLQNWDTLTKNSSVNRRTRYIYTGNLLQAFDMAQSGKLISYTCKNGETKKGILMPEHWDSKVGQKNSERSVPLKFCKRAILGLSRGAVLNTDADISFMMQFNGNIRIFTKSLSLDKFGWLVKNKPLLRYIEETGGFQKSGSTWTGITLTDNLKKVIDLIYEQSACNALLSASQVEMVQPDIVRTEVKEKQQYDLKEITKKHPENIQDNDKEKRLRIAKAKAKAKLKILNLLKL